MKTTYRFGRALTIVAAMTLFAACADNAPIAPGGRPAMQAQLAVLPTATIEQAEAVATMQRVTARYQDLKVALDDEFVLLHECENRPDEGPVGTVYVNFARLLDGVIDPASPDALIYQPGINNERPKLVGVEFALPYPFSPEAPTFLGNTFQKEDEFGVWALHAWVWLHNPEGMFAQTNSRVSCGIL